MNFVLVPLFVVAVIVFIPLILIVVACAIPYAILGLAYTSIARLAWLVFAPFPIVATFLDKLGKKR